MKSILQTPEWAAFKQSQGFAILKLDELFVHKRNLPLNKNFLYLPEVSAKDINAQGIDDLKKLTQDQDSIFARLELLDEFSENAHKLLLSFGFRKSFEEIQPKWRQIIDLNKTRGTLLAEMKQKGRYNIKVAQKHEVKVQKFSSQSSSETDLQKALKIFYGLYNQTGEREKLKGRGLAYFENLMDQFKDADALGVYIASYQNKPVAGALIGLYDGVASYLYGGSSRENKEVMAPYLMHWQIMVDAKEKGCQIYDMIGRSKPDKDEETPLRKSSAGHRWAGVTRFKEQFGGRAVEFLGSYDFVNKPFFYNVFKFKVTY
ncbi:MAG: peptidoglycan bridge formation glycyltransferase FemA/FemB family protein [Candidatus Berkelbacteria bacterium]|nr:peptidoglycan bridge formation glycyltransferase FemA/FemB family protein [Candidatus Berkelbacteria bacterium]